MAQHGEGPIPRQYPRSRVRSRPAAGGFGEDSFIGKRLRLGDKTEVTFLERDPRCAMITLDPDTADRDPAILTHVSKAHDGHAGVYAAVLVEGVFRVGDPVTLLD